VRRIFASLEEVVDVAAKLRSPANGGLASR